MKQPINMQIKTLHSQIQVQRTCNVSENHEISCQGQRISQQL